MTKAQSIHRQFARKAKRVRRYFESGNWNPKGKGYATSMVR